MDSLEFNRAAYDRIASAYHSKRNNPDQSGWNDYLESPAIDSILKPIANNKTILDLGCGTGILTGRLLRWNSRPFGIDPSERMIEIARTEFPGIEFRLGSAENLPYQNEIFDIVASSLVMHYIKNLDPVFRNVYRVLRRNGAFVFSMHHPFNESFKIERKHCGDYPVMQPYFHNSEYFWEMCGERLVSFHHTFENITNTLGEAGFLLKRIVECRPSAASKGKFDGFEFTSKYPTFCVFHATKHI